jgi:hypothetical protein
MAAHSLELLILDVRLAVCKLDPSSGIPSWATRGDFSSITRTHDELSVVCPEDAVPADVRAEKGWRCFRVAGAMDFSAIGVLASMTAPLAGANIGIFAVSTFDTDYLLVKDDDFERAIGVLVTYGHAITRPDRPE